MIFLPAHLVGLRRAFRAARAMSGTLIRLTPALPRGSSKKPSLSILSLDRRSLVKKRVGPRMVVVHE